MTPRTPIVLSYGGGLDSFAMLLDALQRGEKPDHVVFCDVGGGSAEQDGPDPGEWPSTYRHMREIVIPLCQREGIPFHWLGSDAYPIRDARSLFAWYQERALLPIAGPGRVCTVIAKTERFERWCADHFAGLEVEIWIGFEAGEESRAAKDPNAGASSKGKASSFRRRNRFPLLERGLCRCRCEALVRSLGYPVPRKSACVFCPYASKRDWQTFARELPAAFAQVVELEAAKSVTASGKKLSIMGFKSFKDEAKVPKRTRLTILRDSAGMAYVAPPLPAFIEGESREKSQGCDVCGAEQRATKATGCSFLE